jgi:starvation-inducible DNA-binding protein
MNANYLNISKQDLKPIADALNAYLADLAVLGIKLHNLHWNVEGKNFFTLHAKLEEFYDTAAEDLDDVAERILTIGYRPLASLKEYIAAAGISELNSEAVDGSSVLPILIEDFSVMLKKSREIFALADDTGDQGTADLMSAFIGRYEKTLWMLNAGR